MDAVCPFLTPYLFALRVHLRYYYVLTTACCILSVASWRPDIAGSSFSFLVSLALFASTNCYHRLLPSGSPSEQRRATANRTFLALFVIFSYQKTKTPSEPIETFVASAVAF